MVGGLADWFAVTALVPPSARPADPAHRDHPAQQGPHRRGAGQLPQGKFPDPVGRRAADAEISTSPAPPGRFLQTPAGEGTRIRAGASRLIADIFESLDDERLGGIVKSAISSRLRAMEVSPLLGHALASAINEDRHVPMLEAAIRWTRARSTPTSS